MILETHRYRGMDIRSYEPLILSSLRFFDEHYRYLARQRGCKELDGNGKLVLFPGSACETYKMTYNASSTVAALHVVLQAAGSYFMDIIVVTTAKTDEEARELLKQFGMPFKK